MGMVSYKDQVQCPSISDHALIFVTIPLQFVPLPLFVEYRNCKNMDWGGLLGFPNTFGAYDIFNTADLDNKSSLISSLLEHLFSYVPIVRREVYVREDSCMKSRNVTSVILEDRSPMNWQGIVSFAIGPKCHTQGEKGTFL